QKIRDCLSVVVRLQNLKIEPSVKQLDRIISGHVYVVPGVFMRMRQIESAAWMPFQRNLVGIQSSASNRSKITTVECDLKKKHKLTEPVLVLDKKLVWRNALE